MIPALPSQLEPKTITKHVFEKAQARQQSVHNRNAKELKKLCPGEKVWVKFDESSRWHKGVVEKKLKQPERSYMVHMEDGSLLHRNLHPRLEPVTTKSALTPTYPAKAMIF
jgi:hypothetical protein